MDKALTLRLPPEIHERASAAADSLGLTLSAYIRLALVEHSRWKLKETASPRPFPGLGRDLNGIIKNSK